MAEDVRWQQRFSNYVRALEKLTESVEYIEETIGTGGAGHHENIDKVLEAIIKEGLIHRFENTHELAWKVMKDYATFQGNIIITGSRDATREALQLSLVTDGNLWMDMIQSRNKTSHTYNEETADEIYRKIIHEYFPAFVKFQITMEKKRDSEQTNFPE